MAEKEFSITENETPNGIKLILKGSLDYVRSEELQKHMTDTLNEGKKNIILNMHQVDYLCSTGIRVILKTYKDAKNSGGSFGIEMPSERVRNVLGMVALDEMLIT